ncbi:MAG: hypothetical protein KF704_15210 [Crocinitomicaceae bacterium]|nr:hypothetical protein [Crocinitomicaceae bacterium]NGF74707.1 hypothetical protein [Fluviicola sp. SGL-29]
MHSANKKSIASILLISLHVILGIGALFGGGGMIIDPTGALIQLPFSLLNETPFTSFLTPGIILFVLLGILPLITAFGLITKRPWKLTETLNVFPNQHWSYSFSLYIGFLLIGWITIQMYLINGIGLLHVIYIFWGLLIVWVTVVVGNKQVIKS